MALSPTPLCSYHYSAIITLSLNLSIWIILQLCIRCLNAALQCIIKHKTAALMQCPVRRPLSEYVRSSEESGCKCHALRSAAPALLLLKKVHTSRPNIWGSRPYFDPYLSIPPSDSTRLFLQAILLFTVLLTGSKLL